MKPWLLDNDIEIYSMKEICCCRKIYQNLEKLNLRMSAVSKNVCIDKLDEILDKDNNTKHRTTKMKPVDGKSSTNI